MSFSLDDEFNKNEHADIDEEDKIDVAVISSDDSEKEAYEISVDDFTDDFVLDEEERNELDNELRNLPEEDFDYENLEDSADEEIFSGGINAP